MSNVEKGRNLSTKHQRYMKAAGEVSSALRRRPEGSQLYADLQSVEAVLRGSKERFDTQSAAVTAARVSLEKQRKELLVICRAAVDLCDIQGVGQARSILDSDNHDEQAIAASLVPLVRSLPHVGPGVATLLVERRNQWLARESALDELSREFDQVTREYDSAFYRAAATLAQAKGLMAALGTPVGDRKPSRSRSSPSPSVVSVPSPPAVEGGASGVH